jgi:hypothetical protein
MDFEINKSKYLGLIGHIQSGKTNEEINYCFSSVNHYKTSVLFIVRNVTADQIQLFSRFNATNLPVKLLNDIITIEEAVDFLKSTGIIILLCNTNQLLKIKKVLKVYQGDYNLCIDEVDFSIKTKDFVTSTDMLMDDLKNSANHILGATATPFALFSVEKGITKIKKMKAARKYSGIETLNVEYTTELKDVYNSILKKDRAILLHTVTKIKEKQYSIFDSLSNEYPNLTLVVYNGDGITVRCNQKTSLFKNHSISEVLQFLKNQSHISIISGHLASRGISFVSSDYSMHLTDQYLVPSKSAHGENILQSLRILGCYPDSSPLTLWCSKETWAHIIEQTKLLNKLVESSVDSKEWMFKIKEVLVSRPKKPPTRAKLMCKLNGKYLTFVCN